MFSAGSNFEQHTGVLPVAKGLSSLHYVNIDDLYYKYCPFRLISVLSQSEKVLSNPIQINTADYHTRN